jgi:hypothetical protein
MHYAVLSLLPRTAPETPTSPCLQRLAPNFPVYPSLDALRNGTSDSQWSHALSRQPHRYHTTVPAFCSFPLSDIASDNLRPLLGTSIALCLLAAPQGRTERHRRDARPCTRNRTHKCAPRALRIMLATLPPPQSVRA